VSEIEIETNVPAGAFLTDFTSTSTSTTMKRRPLLLSIFSATAFAVTIGCKQESEPSRADQAAPPPSAASPTQLDAVKKETREAG
jgi:hypothetical protein